MKKVSRLFLLFAIALTCAIACTPSPTQSPPSAEDAGHHYGASVIPTAFFTQATQRNYFCGGEDGAALFDGSATPAGSTKNSSTDYSINNDVCYTSLTLNVGILLHTGGYRIYITGLSTVNGTVDNSGGVGGAGTGSGTATGGTAGAVGTLGGGTGTAGNAGSSGTCPANNSWGGSGGAGGTGGGTGGTATPVDTHQRPINPLSTGYGYQITVTTVRAIAGGCGGGGGANNSNSGAGGGEGGIVLFNTGTLTGSGTIQANGGAGGAAISTGTAGGGGGGGVVFEMDNCHNINCGAPATWTGTIQALAGAAGTGGAGSGSAGSAGLVVITPG